MFTVCYAAPGCFKKINYCISKWDLLIFSLFSFTYIVIIPDVHIEVAKFKDNELNVSENNPCEIKADTSDYSERKVSSGHFYFRDRLISAHYTFLYMVICFEHSLFSQNSLLEQYFINVSFNR